MSSAVGSFRQCSRIDFDIYVHDSSRGRIGIINSRPSSISHSRRLGCAIPVISVRSDTNDVTLLLKNNACSKVQPYARIVSGESLIVEIMQYELLRNNGAR